MSMYASDSNNKVIYTFNFIALIKILYWTYVFKVLCTLHLKLMIQKNIKKTGLI
ncbi:MAG: hypothetical protein RUMPE_01235 [Eubacteriales bacterium SKADARSKE-1]|nr:hypothetical protein [Eubacteriales bacterium SKADARSKE-1]